MCSRDDDPTMHDVPRNIRCFGCGARIFETDPRLSEMEGRIIWSHLEDTKCDDPSPVPPTFTSREWDLIAMAVSVELVHTDEATKVWHELRAIKNKINAGVTR